MNTVSCQVFGMIVFMSISTSYLHALNDSPIRLNKEVALKVLIDFTECLNEAQSTWWLSDGTLLGAIREGDFISYDNDIDIGIMADTFTPRVLQLLVKKGFTIVFSHGLPEEGLEFTLKRDETYVDLFLYYPRDKKLYHSCYIHRLKFVRAQRIDFEYPKFDEFVKYKFLGHLFNVPKDPEKHLEIEYGPGWRIPDPQWRWEVDTQNKVPTDIIVNPLKDRIVVNKWLSQFM